MTESMDAADGLGLSGPQVGKLLRLIVVRVGDDHLQLVNPQIVRSSGEEIAEEGCLSLPEISGEVRRPSAITIQALGLDGEPFTMRAGGLLARCWQHEADHLDGVLILDRMTQLSRMKNRSAIRDLEAAAERRRR